MLTLHILVSRRNVCILGCTAADTREEVIAAENMAAKSVPMKTHGMPYVHPNIRTFLPKIRICRVYIRVSPLNIRMCKDFIRIFPPNIWGRGRTAADTR